MPSLGNVTGFATGFSGVRVRVGNSVPPKNPYPWHGFWVTHTVTHHMHDLPLGHQWRRWQQLTAMASHPPSPSPPSPSPPPPPSTLVHHKMNNTTENA